MAPVTSVLIANRGEIAVRIARACADAGIRSIAVYADADRDALHTKVADEAYSIGGNTPGESYLVVEKLSELKEVLQQSRELGVEPLLGVRVRLASIGAGNWQNTGGDKSKFGLHAAQVLQMVEQLREQGLSDLDAQRWRILSRLLGGGDPIQAGEFEIPAGASPSRILDIVQHGRTVQRFVTIPEGMPSILVKERLEAVCEADLDEQMALVASYLDAVFSHGDTPPPRK